MRKVRQETVMTGNVFVLKLPVTSFVTINSHSVNNYLHIEIRFFLKNKKQDSDALILPLCSSLHRQKDRKSCIQNSVLAFFPNLTFPLTAILKQFLLQAYKCGIKMAVYWPSSFSAKKSEAKIQSSGQNNKEQICGSMVQLTLDAFFLRL